MFLWWPPEVVLVQWVSRGSVRKLTNSTLKVPRRFGSTAAATHTQTHTHFPFFMLKNFLKM